MFWPLRSGTLALLAWVVACAGCAGSAEPRPEPTPEEPALAGADERHQLEAPTPSSPSDPIEQLPAEPAPPTGGEASTATATLYSEVSFDLRSMPHRGPYDVDERLITGRVQLLMQRVRDAAGEPAPRLLVYPGASVFRAEFFGDDTQALAQCQRAIAAVARPATDPASRSPTDAVDGVDATPCAPIEPADAP